MKYGYEIAGYVEAENEREAIRKIKEDLKKLAELSDEEFDEYAIIWEYEERGINE